MSLKTTMTKLVVDLCSTIDYVTHIFLNILISLWYLHMMLTFILVPYLLLIF